jgi:hypothetical protein
MDRSQACKNLPGCLMVGVRGAIELRRVSLEHVVCVPDALRKFIDGPSEVGQLRAVRFHPFRNIGSLKKDIFRIMISEDFPEVVRLPGVLGSR